MANAWRDAWLETQLGKDEAQRLILGQAELIRLYGLYDGEGQKWEVKEGLDYDPTMRITNNIKYLIKEVARFMLSRPPEISIQPADDSGNENAKKCAALEDFIRKTLDASGWGGKLSKAGRDQFIGKRVALKVTGGPDQPLRVGFRPAVECWALHDPEDIGRLIKMVYLYQIAESENEEEQRFWYQVYEDNRLNGMGYPVYIDGIYGRETEAAVKRYQSDRGLDADGIVGPLTWAALRVEGHTAPPGDAAQTYTATLHDLTDAQVSALLMDFPDAIITQN